VTEPKRVTNEHGTFVLTRHAESFGLVCDRCLKPKITKIAVEWTTPGGNTKRICNRCYGRFVSGIPL
jgi:hypothetical protein